MLQKMTWFVFIAKAEVYQIKLWSVAGYKCWDGWVVFKREVKITSGDVSLGISRKNRWDSAKCFSERAMYHCFRMLFLHFISLSHFLQPWNWIWKFPAQHSALTSHFFIFCSAACSAHHLGHNNQRITGAYILSFKIFSHTVTPVVVPCVGIFAKALLMRLNSIIQV